MRGAAGQFCVQGSFWRGVHGCIALHLIVEVHARLVEQLLQRWNRSVYGVLVRQPQRRYA